MAAGEEPGVALDQHPAGERLARERHAPVAGRRAAGAGTPSWRPASSPQARAGISISSSRLHPGRVALAEEGRDQAEGAQRLALVDELRRRLGQRLLDDREASCGGAVKSSVRARNAATRRAARILERRPGRSQVWPRPAGGQGLGQAEVQRDRGGSSGGGGSERPSR